MRPRRPITQPLIGGIPAQPHVHTLPRHPETTCHFSHRGAVQLGIHADSYARYAGIVEKWIKPRWDTTPLVKITHEDVAAWISSISRQRAVRP
jgi:hypothetical protein